jgi:plasmid stabilization system protein ParE
MIEAFEEHFALLADLPQIGQKCDEIAAGLLRFPVGKYLVYYRKTRGAIQILHVFHGARDQRNAFRQT